MEITTDSQTIYEKLHEIGRKFQLRVQKKTSNWSVKIEREIRKKI